MTKILGWKRFSTDYEIKHFKRIIYQNIGTRRRRLIDDLIKDILNEPLREKFTNLYGADWFIIPTLVVEQDESTKRGGWFTILNVPWDKYHRVEISGDVNKGDALKEALYFMNHFPDISTKEWSWLRESENFHIFRKKMWKELYNI